MNTPYRLQLITGPATEPVTVADVIANNYLTDIDLTNAKEIQIIEELIATARIMAETTMNRAIISQTWEMSFDCLPDSSRIPNGQFQSITSVKIIDEDGTETTEATSKYSTSAAGDGASFWLKSNSVWTETERSFDVMRVRFVAGWTNAAAVPQNIKTAIMIMVAARYEDREAEIPNRARVELSKHKIYRI